MYFSEEELKPFFGKLAEELSGAEMLFEMLATFLVGKTRYHDSVSKMGQAVAFKWGMKKSKNIESWHAGIRFLEEWDVLDYHKARWKWFGCIGRFPLVRPKCSNRIVHLKFLENNDEA